ncbi:hypothetical protein KA107_00965 [Candidatus Pacearchaeota archaeon]|nr:hypothetical protein [Candidatus Pacearchaeota archaeon]
MQSLGQAVYRYVCFHSKERRRGIGEDKIVQEMLHRGYLEPVRERVQKALKEYGRGEFIKLQSGKYLKNDPPWRSSKESSEKLIRKLGCAA